MEGQVERCSKRQGEALSWLNDVIEHLHDQEDERSLYKACLKIIQIDRCLDIVAFWQI